MISNEVIDRFMKSRNIHGLKLNITKPYTKYDERILELIQMLEDKIKCDSHIRMYFSGLIPTTSELYNDAMDLAAAKKVYNQMRKDRFTMHNANYSMRLLYNLWKERYHPEVSQLYIRTEIVNQVRKSMMLPSYLEHNNSEEAKYLMSVKLKNMMVAELNDIASSVKGTALGYVPKITVGYRDFVAAHMRYMIYKQLYKKRDRWFVSKRHYKVYPSDIDDMYYIQVEGICGRITTIV